MTDPVSNRPPRVFLRTASNDKPAARESYVMLICPSLQMNYRMNHLRTMVTLLVVLATALGACASATTVTPGPTNTPTRVPPTADPSLGIGSTQISDIDGMTLLYVPAGEFTMGSKEGDSNEIPEHSVYLDAFWIDQTEVTKAMYAKCVKAGACFFPMDHYDHLKYDNYPVVFVAWDDAKKYCEWVGGDLPTEAQWEKAARGTDGRLYPWGNQAPDRERLNYNMEVENVTRVGAYLAGASPYGALDMAGNVEEWVADWYGSYPSSSSSNPTGLESGTYRVLRGGTWYDAAVKVRASERRRDYPGLHAAYTGFRCAR